MYYNYHDYAGFGILAALVHILFWILIIWLVVMLFRRHRAGRGDWMHMMDGAPWKKAPLDILKERYAKGEIQKEEFEHKKKDLM